MRFDAVMMLEPTAGLLARLHRGNKCSPMVGCYVLLRLRDPGEDPVCSVVFGRVQLPRSSSKLPVTRLFRYTCHDVMKVVVYSCDYCDVIRSVKLLTGEAVFASGTLALSLKSHCWFRCTCIKAIVLIPLHLPLKRYMCK